MKRAGLIPARGYLLHFTHYDPFWIRNKPGEKPFDLKIGCEIVDALANRGFNLLVVDIGDGVALTSHPELTRHYSVAASQLEAIVTRARGKGLEIVPKLNFSKSGHHGHNNWFHPYDKLEDTDEYWKLAFEVIDELLAICKPDRFFFIGMDEDTHRTDAQYVAAVKRLRNGLKRRGLGTIMWNDTAHCAAGMFPCVQKTLAAEDKAPKDVVHVLWSYQEVRRCQLDRVQNILDKGIDAWVAPGTNADYLRSWRQIAADKGYGGMLMTSWRPVNTSTRKELLDGIEKLGPIYASACVPGGGKPVIAESALRVHAPRPDARALQTPPGRILAPNVLKNARSKSPYLLPPEIYVRNWMVLGPFPFDAANCTGSQQQGVIDDDSFLRVAEADLSAGEEGSKESGAMWRRYVAPAGEAFPQIVDLSRMYGGREYALAYLVANVYSAKAVSDYRLCLGSDDYIKVWLNGQAIHTFNKECRGVRQDDDIVDRVVLRKGWNVLLVKCANIRATWGLLARFADAKGQPIVTSTATPGGRDGGVDGQRQAHPEQRAGHA